MGILKSIDHVKLTSVNKFLIPAMLNGVLDNAKEDRNVWTKRINMVLVIRPIRIDNADKKKIPLAYIVKNNFSIKE